MPRNRWGKSRLLIAGLVGCLTPLVVMGTVGAAPGPVATAIRIDSVVTPGVTVPLTADTPSIWVAANTPFTVSATTVNGTTPAPLSSTKDVTVKISAVTPSGTVNLGTIVVPKDTTAISFQRTLAADIDDAFIHLESVEKRGDPVRQGDSDTFDVQSDFSDNPAGQNLDVAIGADVNGAECTPTVAEKICFELHFPAGSTSSSHLLSLGNCNVVNPCQQNLDYWWSLVQVNATRDNPAIVDMGLDKSLKGILFSAGVPKAKWLVRASGATTWVEAPPCPSKGVVGADQEFCHDVAEGHRDNSGDTWIRLLWLRDIRGSIK